MAKKKSGAAKTRLDRQLAAAQAAASKRKYIWSIILFTIALFMLFVVLIEGQAAWSYLHSFNLGLFGICSYIWPLFIGYIAIMLAMDKPSKTIRYRSAAVIILLFLIGALIDIFITSDSNASFGKHIVESYKNGSDISGGGFFGALFGYPLFMLFGKTGARITIILLVFVFIMLLTGTTLISLYKAVSTPAKKIGKTAENIYITQRERHEERNLAEQSRFDIDIPISGDVSFAPQKTESNLAEKRKKVVAAYRDSDRIDIPIGNDAPIPESNAKDVSNKKPEIKQEPPVIDDALLEKINGNIIVKSADTAKPVEEAKPKKEDPVPPMNIQIESEDKNAEYRFPPISLLKVSKPDTESDIRNELTTNAEKLVNTLKSFGVETRVIDISRGPAVTRYELQPAAGVRINRITNLADDIALNLAAAGVRIEAPIPNKSAVGIEVPNKIRSSVGIRELIESPVFENSKSKLTGVLGKDITGNICTMDIAKMPHVLIAGTTGSGKSVCLNSIIVSLLYKASPDEVKMLMIDPKAVEMDMYNGIPHLLVPVVIDPRKAAGALGWAVTEMLHRYQILHDNNVKNLESYNKLAEKRDDLKPMPQIVIVIDELADLMMAAPNEVEDSICRLAQMARAAGMHLVIATQRPSVDVITGLIKANIPSRIALTCSTQIDSRTILDMAGAEKLIGMGDMLYFPVGSVKPTRVQGCWVSDGEIESIVSYIKGNQTSEYDSDVMSEIERQAAAEKSSKKESNDDGDKDVMFNDAVECVIDAGQASTSLLQRRLKLGYARAARIIDQMEENGIVGPYEGSKPRQVILTRQQWMEMQAIGTDEKI